LVGISGHGYFFPSEKQSYINIRGSCREPEEHRHGHHECEHRTGGLQRFLARRAHTTFFVSTTASWANTKNCFPGSVVHPTTEPAAIPASTLATRNTHRAFREEIKTRDARDQPAAPLSHLILSTIRL